MQHPSLSAVWTYQTLEEQETLQGLFDEWSEHQYDMDELIVAQRRLLARAYLRRKRGANSFAFDYYAPMLSDVTR